MKNWAYYITGDSPESLQGHSPESIRKIKILASVILLPAIIWVMLGYCFGSTFLKMGFLPSLTCGIVAGTVVFLVDRLIIMAGNTGAWIKIARFTLAIMVAVLGAIVADHVIFEDDIKMMMSKIRSEKVDAEVSIVEEKHSNRLDELRSDLESAEVRVTSREEDYLAETDGSGGTGKRGVGDVAKEKKQAWVLARANYQNTLAEYNHERAIIDEKRAAASTLANANFSNSALLTQIKAMFRFLSENPIAMVFWGPFTLIMFILEVLPLLIKSNMADSAYETELKYMEEIRKRRVDLMKSEFEREFNIESQYSSSDRGAMRILSNHQLTGIAS